MPFPQGLGWLSARSGELQDRYRHLRGDHDPIPAFQLTLAEALDDEDYERLQAFFDGQRDVIYGAGAGARALEELETRFELGMLSDPSSPPSATRRDGDVADLATLDWGFPADHDPAWDVGEASPTASRDAAAPTRDAARRRKTIVIAVVVIAIVVGFIIAGIVTGGIGSCKSDCDSGDGGDLRAPIAHPTSSMPYARLALRATSPSRPAAPRSSP